MIRILLAAAMAIPATAALAAPVPSGLWRMTDGKAEIRVSDCGGSLCATLVGLRKPNDKQGRPKVDRENPNPALRDRPVIGLALVSGMKAEGSEWTGRFYNPDDGKTYLGRISADGPDRLKMKGCVLGGWICKTRTLARAD